jgi:hypothetical protein
MNEIIKGYLNSSNNIIHHWLRHAAVEDITEFPNRVIGGLIGHICSQIATPW